jgi:restriction endonuclease Mrr
MNNSDIAKLIEEIQKNYSLINQIRTPAIESAITELVAQSNKMTEMQRDALKGVDLAKYKVIDSDLIRKLQGDISTLHMEKGFFVTSPHLTEATRVLAQQYNRTMELADRSVFRDMVSQYESIHSAFSERLFEQLNSLKLSGVIDIAEPTPEEIEQIRPESTELSEPQKSALIAVDSIPLRLIARILRSPHEVRNLSPREFEEFVAETLSQLGFKDVFLTPRSHDGGKDIIASHQINGIPLSFYFECKKYSEGNKVQLERLRALLGTLAHDARNVNKGVLVTTSTFTKGSKEFILSESRLDGKDYDGILGWIDELRSKT